MDGQVNKHISDRFTNLLC